MGRKLRRDGAVVYVVERFSVFRNRWEPCSGCSFGRHVADHELLPEWKRKLDGYKVRISRYERVNP